MPVSYRRFLLDDGGGSLFDYALIAAVFALAMLAATSLVGTEAANQLSTTQGQLTNAASMTQSSTGLLGGGGK